MGAILGGFGGSVLLVILFQGAGVLTAVALPFAVGLGLKRRDYLIAGVSLLGIGFVFALVMDLIVSSGRLG